MEKFYRIAGLTVKMDSYGRTVEQAEAYRCAPCANPDIVIQSAWEKMKQKYPEMSDDVGEYLYSGSSFYKQLLDFDGLMLHSSAVVVDGKAYLFTAPSGTGKSTHTKLWLDLFGDRAFILNDDKPALRLEDGVWYAYGTPWSGKSGINRNEKVPLGGICFLKRGTENRIRRLSAQEAVPLMYMQTNYPLKKKENMHRLLSAIEALVQQIPIYELENLPEPDAAQLSMETMQAGL